jgi:hypothetical protein
VTVLIDVREKPTHRLQFPAWINLHPDRSKEVWPVQVKTKDVVLPAGDYTIEGWDHQIVVETKRSLRELFNNVCTADWERERKAIVRLANSCLHPYLIMEMTPSELLRESTHVEDPALVLDRWMQLVARFDLKVMFCGGSRDKRPRRNLGEMVLRLMLSHMLNPMAEVDTWSPGLRKFMWNKAPVWLENSRKKHERQRAENDLRDGSPEGDDGGQASGGADTGDCPPEAG